MARITISDDYDTYACTMAQHEHSTLVAVEPMTLYPKIQSRLIDRFGLQDYQAGRALNIEESQEVAAIFEQSLLEAAEEFANKRSRPFQPFSVGDIVQVVAAEKSFRYKALGPVLKNWIEQRHDTILYFHRPPSSIRTA